MKSLDKYEYNLKLDEIKDLLSQGKNDEAAELADSINWNKVKNVNALVKAGEVYEKVGRYDDARDILLNAYDRSPIGRTIIYRLAELAIKMEDFAAAKEYYDEFVDIAPHDNQRYVLMYNIKKANGAAYAELIPILEEFKEQEYTEEWAFELAYMYHKSGMIDKCIDACDELILWFGDGPYVERALELKMLYEPLTKMQEEKYRQFRQEKEGKTVISIAEMEQAGNYSQQAVAIPQVTLNPSRFNTINLQEEIAKGMQQIIDATEKETVVGTMDNIKKIVEEIPYLQLPTEEELAAKESSVHIETDAEIDGSLKINFQELLGEDSDGQMSLVMKEKAMLERQITGQMTISEVLEEWEKTKRAAEAALQEAEQRKLESAKARALQEAEDIMVRLNDVLPKIETATTPEELFDNMNSALDKEISRLSNENIVMDEHLQKLGQEIAWSTRETVPIPKLENALPPIVLEGEATPEVEEVQQEEVVEEFVNEAIYTQEPLEEVEEELVEEIVPKEAESFETEIPETDVIIEDTILMDATRRIPNVVLEEESSVEQEEVLEEENIAEEKNLKELLEDMADLEMPAPEIIHELTEEQKAIFSYFIPVKGMEPQLCKALTGIMAKLDGRANMSAGNLIIQGCQGCGKTVLATSIIKVLQNQCGRPNGKIGKIDASALNKKDVQQLLRKVSGGCLIIEKAGEIDRTAAVAMSLLLEQDESGILIILEDTAAGIKKALATDDGFAKKFTESVSLPIFTNDELVLFANAYAKELGYVIDEMAILALHNRISNIEKLDQATTLVEVKDIIDEAIEREANSGIRKAFNILTAKRYTDDDEIVLTEKDFE